MPDPARAQDVSYYDVPKGDGPRDVAPAPDGTVWYTGQRAGVLGRLDPKTGHVDRIKLGEDSAPHAWALTVPHGSPMAASTPFFASILTTHDVKRWPVPPKNDGANLNTAAFDGRGPIWFTGQSGIFGRSIQRPDR